MLERRGLSSVLQRALIEQSLPSTSISGRIHVSGAELSRQAIVQCSTVGGDEHGTMGPLPSAVVTPDPPSPVFCSVTAQVTQAPAGAAAPSSNRAAASAMPMRNGKAPRSGLNVTPILLASMSGSGPEPTRPFRWLLRTIPGPCSWPLRRLSPSRRRGLKIFCRRPGIRHRARRSGPVASSGAPRAAKRVQGSCGPRARSAGTSSSLPESCRRSCSGREYSPRIP